MVICLEARCDAVLVGEMPRNTQGIKMAEIALMRQPGPILVPATDDDVHKLDALRVGQVYTTKIKLSVNGLLHRKMLALIRLAWEHQEGYQDNFTMFRKAVLIAAGHCDMIQMPDGAVHIEAKSISYDEMPDDIDRQELFGRVKSALIARFMPSSWSLEDMDRLAERVALF